jgi:hypothetical protein
LVKDAGPVFEALDEHAVGTATAGIKATALLAGPDAPPTVRLPALAAVCASATALSNKLKAPSAVRDEKIDFSIGGFILRGTSPFL